MGAPGTLYLFKWAPLRLVSASRTEGGAGQAGVGDATGLPLPTFGQYPVVSVSGGVAWVMSDGQIACLNAQSGRLEAIVEQHGPPIVDDPVAVTSSGIFAVANTDRSGGPGTGLVQIFPPLACRR